MTDAIKTTISPFKGVSVTVDATSRRRWQQACPLKACPLKACLTLKLPPRAQSINVAQLKTLAEIVAHPEHDRFDLHYQNVSRVSSIDRRLEYLYKHDLIQGPDPQNRYLYQIVHEFVASDTGIFLIRTWQKDRPITDLIDAFQAVVDMTQGSRETTINVTLLYVLKQIVSERASTVAELIPLCDHNRVSTQFRLKNLVKRRLLEPDV